MCVGNRVAQIMDLIPTDCWSHVVSEESSRLRISGTLSLLHHDLWWFTAEIASNLVAAQ